MATATFCTVGRCTRMYDVRPYCHEKSSPTLPTGTCDMPVIAFYRSDPRAFSIYIHMYIYIGVCVCVWQLPRTHTPTIIKKDQRKNKKKSERKVEKTLLAARLLHGSKFVTHS